MIVYRPAPTGAPFGPNALGRRLTDKDNSLIFTLQAKNEVPAERLVREALA